MRNSFLSITLFLGIVVLLSCSSHTPKNNTDSSTVNNPTYGKWQQAETQPITFEQILTIGNNKELILPSTYQIKGPVTDQPGNIYFIDGKAGKLYSFDQQGNMLWSTGNVGEGPGDFKQPQGLATNGTHLYTANVQGSRLDKFNMDGEFINSSNLKKFDVTFSRVEGFFSDTLLVLGSTTWEKVGRKITILNVADTTKIHSQFEITPVPPLELGPGLSVGFDISIIDSFIVAGNVESYAFYFYDMKGKKVKSITRNFDGLTRPGVFQNGGQRAVASYSRLNAPVDLKNGYYFATLSWATNVDDPDQFLKQDTKEPVLKNAIDLYRANGRLLYTIESDGYSTDIGTISHVDSNGYLYTKSNTPFPQIQKYKVTISPPGK